MKTQVKRAFSCKAFLQKRRLSLVLFPYSFAYTFILTNIIKFSLLLFFKPSKIFLKLRTREIFFSCFINIHLGWLQKKKIK